MKSLFVEGFKEQIKPISMRNKILWNLPLNMTEEKWNDHPKSLPVLFYFCNSSPASILSKIFRNLSASDGTAQIPDCSDSDCIDCLLPFSEETPIYKQPNYFAAFILLISYYCLIQHKIYTILQEKIYLEVIYFQFTRVCFISEQQARKLASAF